MGGFSAAIIHDIYESGAHEGSQARDLALVHTRSWAESDPDVFQTLFEEAPRDFAVDMHVARDKSGWSGLKRREIIRELVGVIGGWWEYI